MSDSPETAAAPAVPVPAAQALVDKAKQKLAWTFWMLCTMEMWERLAYYGMRVVVGIYIAQADEPGGLHFTQAEKGTIFAWWAIFQSVLPCFTGGFSDRYGYKNTIVFAVTLKVVGYVLMATQRSYAGFFLGAMILATGTAQFKPGIQGSLAQSLGKGNSSKGWGIFYWLVNVGAMLGPPLAGMLRKLSWDGVFFGCAGIVALNYLMLFTYKEVSSGYEGKDGLLTVFWVTLKNFFEPRLLVFLLILSGFWMMMYQLWDLHPNFIADWVDSSSVAATLPIPAAWTKETERGVQVLQENLLNLNAALIVLFVIPMSIFVARLRSLTAMLIGTAVATGGIIVSGLTANGWILLCGIALFSAGEMLTGPKKLEYMGLIAPPGKKALYLGYVNIPVGIGQGIGAKISGWYYGSYGEKAVLAQRYLAEHTDYLSRDGRPAWDGHVATLTQTLGVERPEAYAALREELGQDGASVTRLLWDTYAPYQVWYLFAGVGVASLIGLILYSQRAKRWGTLNQ
ncbi:MAG: MFS transporter [Polyangiaceae bacterium]|nr:MFS transporter [Polyangiaceae bacterium]